MKKEFIAVLTGTLLLTACINIKMVNVGQKTAYERQLTGTYEELDSSLATVASVRGPGSSDNGSTALSESYQKALSARRRQLFNEDDIAVFKSEGCIGENIRGQAEVLPCELLSNNADKKELVARLVAEDNEDRKNIIDLAIQMDNSLTPANVSDMRSVYHQLLRDSAKSGYMFEESPGKWTKIN